jgi:tetratricopeptide (TPR) repeat protein
MTRALLISLLISLSACTPHLRIQSTRPSAVNLGARPNLSIIDVNGNRRDLQESVVAALLRQRRGSALIIKDKRALGLKVTLNGQTPTFSGPEYLLKEGEHLLSVSIVDVEVQTETRTETQKDAKGNPQEVEYTALVADVAITATIADADTAPLAEKEYSSKIAARDSAQGPSKLELKERALSDAVSQLLADVTPVTVTAFVALDDEDKALEPYLDLATSGQLEQAIEGLKDHLERHPSGAAAWYNLAVLYDALGRYDEALDAYDAALERGNKDLYVKGRAGCVLRQRGVNELR